ncbi:uncharacterized protein TNIN_293081 [Trichonephila inaurata madagascariensis]|uniref:Uncharacterized protein n=1 Tax=Trichonephila inaurata madagascariensis TaxID=2747483 RepID=A0A8X6WTM6_9ARAC|nr:uncharacterized protein TNIN_293081 [Trichonephila inaurata madagascariensis]
MPLKNKSYRARKHPSFNRASKAQRLRRIEEKRCNKEVQTDLRGICYLAYSEFESKLEKCEVAVQTDASEDIVHEDVTHQNNGMSEAKSLTSLRTPQNVLTAEDMSDLPDLCIETSINCTENCLCNLSHMIAQVKQLELHSYSCNFSGIFVFKKMIKCGLYTKLHYMCSDILCNEETVVTTDSEKNTLNNLSVLGALSTGSGFSQEKEKFSVMNIRLL